MSGASSTGAGAGAPLSDLTPAQQLRLRTFNETSFAPDVVGSLVGGMLPPQLLEDEREAVCAALAASLKGFVVLVAEEAVAARRAQQDPREAHEDAASGAGALLQPAHLLEAYRRLALRGQVLGAPAAHAAAAHAAGR